MNKTFRGIDISDHNTWQKMPDFNRVKKAGNSFVLVRIGWCGYAGEIHQDERAEKAVKEALAAGLDVGLYVYSYALTEQAAKKAAREAVAFAKKFTVTYPIILDIENTDDEKCAALTRQQNTAIVAAFCAEVERLKYYAMFYTYTSFALGRLTMGKLKQYDFWVADYRSRTKCPYGGEYGIWQYIGDAGRVDGVAGACDMDIAYKDYPAIIRRAGLNNL